MISMPLHGPSLSETTAFIAVVELKSFTKAAKQLALSPPRVSEMVRSSRIALACDSSSARRAPSLRL